MTSQLEMPLAKPRVGMVDVKTLTDYLRGCNDWQHASELISLFYLPDDESGRRFIRRVADIAAPEIISGQKGYRHIYHATDDEINHCANALESQARKMHERAIAIRKRKHYENK